MAMNAEELTTLSLFEGLSADQLAKLAPLFRRVSFGADDYVFVKGEDAREIYVVEDGTVAIRFGASAADSVDVATIQPGGVFGWSAALGRAHYTSSAVCRTKTHALAAHGSQLREVIRNDPELGELVLARMADVAANRIEGLAAQLVKLFPKD